MELNTVKSKNGMNSCKQKFVCKLSMKKIQPIYDGEI